MGPAAVVWLLLSDLKPLSMILGCIQKTRHKPKESEEESVLQVTYNTIE